MFVGGILFSCCLSVLYVLVFEWGYLITTAYCHFLLEMLLSFQVMEEKKQLDV